MNFFQVQKVLKYRYLHGHFGTSFRHLGNSNNVNCKIDNDTINCLSL